MKQLSVAIVELYEHTEVVNYLCNVITKIGHVEVFVRENLSREILCKTSKITSMKEEGSADCFRSIYKRLDEKDVLIISTIVVDSKPWKLLEELKPPKILLVHNANWTFSESITWLPLTVKRFFRRLKWNLNGDVAARIDIVKAMNGFVFPSKVIEDHVVRLKGLPDSIEGAPLTLGIPWAIEPYRSFPLCGERRLRIVVPGQVNFEVRDYGVLYEALMNIYDKIEHITVELLGSPATIHDAKMISKFSEMASSRINIIRYSSFIPTHQYEESLSLAHVVLNLHKGVVEFASQQEIAGKTKTSGVVHDAIRHGKPLWRRPNSAEELVGWILAAQNHPFNDIVDFPIERMPIEKHISSWQTFLSSFTSTERQPNAQP